MVIESALDPKVQAIIDRTTLALRTSSRAMETRSGDILGGHYRAAITTGLTTVLAAGDRIFSMQWKPAEPGRRFVLLRLAVAASMQTAFGAAQETVVDLVKLTGFSAPDAGGTAQTLGNGFRLSLGSGPSQIADLRRASATAVTAGTSAVDSQIGVVHLNLPNTAGLADEKELYRFIQGVGSPLELNTNEGLNARLVVTQGAAGVQRFTFTMEWVEVPLSIILA